jgi:pullulanase/glycogen debranching enzyme
VRNYWGYNSIGLFAPHNEYASGGQRGQQVQEFKQLVKRLHEAGIEVILDVVYNHTAEGNHLGPTLSFKGIDNAAYYRLVPDDRRYYFDYTGTGNSLNRRHPHVPQLLMDSLRYWVQEMHMDGFRFDLAATLARELHAVDRLLAFFDLMQQDPVVGQAKLIAEPWDVGEAGYQVGNFLPYWSEWNGKYRDCVRDYWRSIDQTLNEFASRLSGSSDLDASTGRRPFASINFITAHDGFTLRDLVSYNEKHEANGEDNRDGESHNRSWNCGAEGPTDDPEINALRARQQRNFLATLFLSQGVPMLLGGDEIGRTQGGNTNAYCQDNEISWFNWQEADWDLFEVVAGLIRLRQAHTVFRRRRFFLGRAIHGTGVGDIGWLRPDGQAMSEEDWQAGYAKSLAVYLNGQGLHELDVRGQQLVDDSFYLMFNAHYEPLTFTTPQGLGAVWVKVLDTHEALSKHAQIPGDLGVPLPANEAQRLQDLYHYQVLDTEPESTFDDLTQLAAQICQTPIAAVSLVDATRQWFKAKVGLAINETPRKVAFCAHTIVQGDLLEVPDATRDERFAANPLVVEDPHVRFYAGAPLISPAGHALGTLCVLDFTPRELSAEQKEALRTISRQVVTQLELRLEMRRMAENLAAQMSAEANRPVPMGFLERVGQTFRAGEPVPLEARSMVLLRLAE